MPRWQFIPNDTPVEQRDELVWGWWVAPEMNELSTIAINIRLFDGTRGPTIQLSPDRGLTGLLIDVAKATEMPIATFRLQIGAIAIPDPSLVGRVLSDAGLSDGSAVSMVGTGVGGGKRGGVKKNGLKDKDDNDEGPNDKRADRLVLTRHKAWTLTEGLTPTEDPILKPVQAFLQEFWTGLKTAETQQTTNPSAAVQVLSNYLQRVSGKDLCQTVAVR